MDSNVSINRVFRLHKRCATVILNAEPRHSSIDLFNKLSWLPFYLESDIKTGVLAFNRINNNVPGYISKLLALNGHQHTRITPFSNAKFLTHRYGI